MENSLNLYQWLTTIPNYQEWLVVILGVLIVFWMVLFCWVMKEQEKARERKKTRGIPG